MNTERQLWEILSQIPVVNVPYGTIRCIVYLAKKNNDESVDSAKVAVKGLIDTAMIATAIYTAPVTIPLIAGETLSGIVTKSVSDSVEVIVFFVTNSEQLHGKNSDEREKIFYDKIKRVGYIGGLYSAVRAPVYLIKKNKHESADSSINCAKNVFETALKIGIGCIPAIDRKLQRLIEKTLHSMVKFSAKELIKQVSAHRLSLIEASNALEAMETDCETILDANCSDGSKRIADCTTIANTENANTKGLTQLIWKWKPSEHFSLSSGVDISSTSKFNESQNTPQTNKLSNDAAQLCENTPNIYIILE